MENAAFDYVIIGAGAAGLTSAQYAARSGLKTLVIDLSTTGGQVLQIPQLENYPGVFPPVAGSQLIANMQKQAEAFGTQFVQADVSLIDKVGSFFHVYTKDAEYISPVLLIATGAAYRTLNVAGEKEFLGAGVSYCAVCDGPFFRNKDVVVVGGGDSACMEALYLASIANHVLLIHRRDTLRAQQTVIDRLKADEKITVRYNSIVKEIKGSSSVKAVMVEDLGTGELQEIPADAVFIFIGMLPRTELISTLPKDEKGYIITNENMETSVAGLYCAGDIRSKTLRQIVTAAADGAIAARSAENYIRLLHGNGAKL